MPKTISLRRLRTAIAIIIVLEIFTIVGGMFMATMSGPMVAMVIIPAMFVLIPVFVITNLILSIICYKRAKQCLLSIIFHGLLVLIVLALVIVAVYML